MDSIYTGTPDSSSTGVTDPAFQAAASRLGYNIHSLTGAQYQDVLYHLNPSTTPVLPPSMHIENGHVVDYDRNANANKILLAVGGGLVASPLIAGALGGGGGAAAGSEAAGVGADTAGAGTLAGASTVSPIGALAGGAPSGLVGGAGVGSEAALSSAALPSTQIGNGLATLPNAAPSGLVSGGVPAGSTLSTIGNALRDPSTLSAAGKAISAATTASQSNQRQDANITQNAYVQDAQLEAQQRREALRNIYAQGVVSSGQHGPYDPTPPIPSAAYIAALNNLQQQGSQRLGQPAQYATTNFPNPNSYTNPTTLQTAGTYLGPALQIAGTFLGR